jgi:hypothetical protein
VEKGIMVKDIRPYYSIILKLKTLFAAKTKDSCRTKHAEEIPNRTHGHLSHFQKHETNNILKITFL